MFSNIFCIGSAIWTAYLIFDGFRQGSIRFGRNFSKNRVDRDESPVFFYMVVLFYSAMVIFFTVLPIAGVDIFDR